MQRSGRITIESTSAFTGRLSNEKYRMMYLNMGHNDMDYEHHTNLELSYTLTNQIQDKLIIDGLLWLGKPK